ncbi:hypothetical protein VP1G_08010 [Cytospora mali]|uniref:Uncharacterized protein n=1 Tax=Cytospora mali TaxID=578113 RepID=A0A194VAI9_CYTMA|nr:hypothetical protein VP1G_08010 [Valsa mali var. pyri (nom. inval.)]
MASIQPKDVEALGAGLSTDNQEKQFLREMDQQAVSRPDPRPARARTMATRRRLLLALSMCCLAALGFTSTYQVRMPCHKNAGNVEHAVVDVEDSALSSLLGPNSVDSLREVLGKYVPGSYHQEDGPRMAKRQDEGNATASLAATTAVTTVSTPGPTTTITSSAASSSEAATTPTTTAEAATTPESTTSAAATTSATSTEAATTPTTSAVVATTPTTSVAATTSVQTTVETSIETQTQTAAPTTPTTTATPTSSESSASSVRLFLFVLCSFNLSDVLIDNLLPFLLFHHDYH